MKRILATSHVESTKSKFVIDLVKHCDNFLYVEVSQTIVADKDVARSIKIHSDLLPKLLDVLRNYEAKLLRHHRGKVNGLTESDQEKVQHYYFKGVSIKEMSTFFSQPEELIENSLRNRGIKIVSLEPPKFRYRRRLKKKRS